MDHHVPEGELLFFTCLVGPNHCEAVSVLFCPLLDYIECEVIVFRHVNVEITIGFLIVANVACIFVHIIAPYMLDFLRYIHSRTLSCKMMNAGKRKYRKRDEKDKGIIP